MRVLLAGGGTAGHTSPLIATADALRRLDPDAEITCLGTPRGLENRVVPEAGYPLELIPPVPLPRRPNADLLKVPARLRGAVTRDARGPRPGPPRRRRRLRRLRLDAGLPRRAPPQAAAGRPRAERAARPGQQGRRPGRRAGRGQLPRHPAAAGRVRRPADPPDDLHARPGRAAGRGARLLRARPRPAHAARHRRLAGRAPAQPVGLRRRPRPRRRRASRCSTSSARRARRPRARPTSPTSSSPSSTGWTSPTPPPTWSSAGPAPPASPRPRPSACRRCSCRCRSATASRSTTPAPSSTPAVALLVADDALTPEWVAATVPGPGHRRRPARRDGRGRRRR